MSPAPKVYDTQRVTNFDHTVEELGLLRLQLCNIANELAAMRVLLERQHKEVCHAPGPGLVTQKPADTEEAPGEGQTPVCSTCNDRHMVERENGSTWMCTRCPLPCDSCKRSAVDAYCATTPCHCECHTKARP